MDGWMLQRISRTDVRIFLKLRTLHDKCIFVSVRMVVSTILYKISIHLITNLSVHIYTFHCGEETFYFLKSTSVQGHFMTPENVFSLKNI